MENSVHENSLRPTCAGFTLLEVIIAISIMVIAFASILSVESSSVDASYRARQMSVVAMLAKNEMVNTEYEIQGKTFDEFKKEDGAQFKEPFNDYRWTREVKEIAFPSLSMGSSSPGNPDESTDTIDLMTKLVSQFLSQAMREVIVTIHWQKSGKDQSFSLTTYWVDLNHEFQMSQ